jgi:hypothetical protein
MSIGEIEREAVAYPAGPDFNSAQQLDGLAFRIPIDEQGASVIVTNGAALDYGLIPRADNVQKRGQFEDPLAAGEAVKAMPVVDVVIATLGEAKVMAGIINPEIMSSLRGNEGSMSFYGLKRAVSLLFFDTSTSDTRTNQQSAFEQHVPAAKNGRIGEALKSDKFEVVLAQAIRTTAHKAVKATLTAHAKREQDKVAQDAADHRAEKIAIVTRKIFFPKTEDLQENIKYEY